MILRGLQTNMNILLKASYAAIIAMERAK